MTKGAGGLAAVLLTVTLVAACGYRWVDATPGGGLLLATLENSTSEPGLARLLRRALEDETGIRAGRGAEELSVVVTHLEDRVDSVTAEGTPLRQRLSMEFAWRISAHGGEARGGRLQVESSYPWSEEPARLQWTRQAALQLLCEDAARALAGAAEELR